MILTKNNIKKKRINQLMHSKNKHIYYTLVSLSITELEDAMWFQNVAFILGDY